MKATIFCCAALVLAAPAVHAMNETDSVTLPGLHSAVQVDRDSDGIPHIRARDLHDMAMVQGYVMAGDRLFQMDLARRQASGSLAELFGAGVLGDDVEARTIGLRRAAERSLPALSAQTREALEAFAAGVNAWTDSHALPPEYGLLELSRFQPWSALDSVVVGKGLAFQLSFDLDIENTLIFQTYLQTGAALGFDGAALFFEDLFRAAPFHPAATVPDAAGAGAGHTSVRQRLPAAVANAPGAASLRSAGAVEALSSAARSLAEGYLERVRHHPLFADAVRPFDRARGSNEWGVHGSRTASGRPLLANDPHLALNTPATFYQNHLVARKDHVDVHGSSVPGVPFVVLGQTGHVTWGATTNGADVTDTYLEQLAPSADSPVGLGIVHAGQIEPIDATPLLFRYNVPGDGQLDNLVTAPPNGSVAGVFVPAVVLTVPRRIDGPIVNLDLATMTALSVQYTGFAATRELDTFRLWNQSDNLEEFVHALQFFDFGAQNWAYADVNGNIAYFASAEVPVREDLQANTINGAPPIFIRNGSGGNEWLALTHPQPGQAVPYEVLPADELPHLVNPPYFVNANNDPAGTTLDNQPFLKFRPGGGIYYLNYSYAPGMRAGRITERLQAQLAAGPVTIDDMKALQADVGWLDAERLTPHLLGAFDRAGAPAAPAELAALAADPRIAEAIGRLRNWQFNGPTGVDTGYDASDVDGGLSPPSNDEVEASVAATIYAVWRARILRNTIDATLAPFGLPTPSSNFAMKALAHLLEGFPLQQGVGASGLDFFAAAPPLPAEARRDFVLLASLGEALDRLAGPAFADAFAGSTNQLDYRWGRLHRIVFDHPFGAATPFSIPPAGGAFPGSFADLPGIATDGGFNNVDASSHSARADGAHAFTFGGGPARRYVAEPGRHPRSLNGETILPGGNSGVLGSPFYANLLGRWLTNDYYAARIRLAEIREARVSRTVFRP